MSKIRTADQILAVAKQNDWEVTVTPGMITARKGKRRVFVEFSVRGAVTFANSERHRFLGQGKANQVLEELAR
jgi:hypothetical protein